MPSSFYSVEDLAKILRAGMMCASNMGNGLSPREARVYQRGVVDGLQFVAQAVGVNVEQPREQARLLILTMGEDNGYQLASTNHTT